MENQNSLILRKFKEAVEFLVAQHNFYKGSRKGTKLYHSRASLEEHNVLLT